MLDSLRCPLHSRKQTSFGTVAMSALCHKQTHALQQIIGGLECQAFFRTARRNCFIVRDRGAWVLAYVYFEDEPGHRSGILTWP
jgi:hypothetical protein